MPVKQIVRQVPARVFLDILNTQSLTRQVNLGATEYVSEYELKNNTLVVKIIDKRKLEKFRKGQLVKPNPNSITNLTGNKFPVGRFNSIQIAQVINTLNNNLFLKQKFGFGRDDVIQTLDSYGSKSVVARGYNRNELEREQAQGS